MCSVPKLPICIFLSVSSWVHFENYSLAKYDFILFFKLKQNGSSGYLGKKKIFQSIASGNGKSTQSIANTSWVQLIKSQVGFLNSSMDQ